MLAELALRAEVSTLEELDQAPLDGGRRETLFLWESRAPCIVLPRSGSIRIHLLESAPADLVVHRRESGGGAVMLGRGCLNYALVLSLSQRPALVDVDYSYRAILGTLLRALRVEGTRTIGSDLVLGDRKFGGHAQRRTRHALLHHGTILYGFELSQMSEVLREPLRQPAYRRGRPHSSFLVNLPLSLQHLLHGFLGLAEAMTLTRHCQASGSEPTFCPVSPTK